PSPAGRGPRVFAKCARGEREGDRRPGWGLGLFFCRLAIDAHGGSIAVEDVAGWSTSLVIRLPGSTAHAQIPAAERLSPLRPHEAVAPPPPRSAVAGRPRGGPPAEGLGV